MRCLNRVLKHKHRCITGMSDMQRSWKGIQKYKTSCSFVVHISQDFIIIDMLFNQTTVLLQCCSDVKQPLECAVKNISHMLALSQVQKLNDMKMSKIWRRNSRSAKEVNSIRKRLRRLVSSAHILTTPTPVSSMTSLATVLQNLACKKPHTVCFDRCGCAVSLRPRSVEQLLYIYDSNMTF